VKSVVEQVFFREFIFDNKALKKFEFQIWWKRSKCSTTNFICTESTEKPVFFSNSTYHTNYSKWTSYI